MDGNQNAALPHTAVIALRFIFRDAHTNQCSDQSPDSASHTHTGQRCREWPRRDKWAESRNSQGPYSDQEAKRTTDCSARTYSCRGAFRSFGVFLVYEILGSLVVGE